MSSTIPANVNEVANAAFLREVQEMDPRRSERLAKIDPSARRMVPTGEGWTVGVCAACGGAVVEAPFVERGRQAGHGREFCSKGCRDGRVVAIDRTAPAAPAPNICKFCGLPLADDRRKDARYCDSTCERNARFAKNGGRQSRMVA